MRAVLGLGVLLALAACAAPQQMCFVSAAPGDAAPPAPRTVMRGVTYSTGCVIVPVAAVDYRLPEGEEVAGRLVAEGATARLLLTGVAFAADGGQSRLTLEATFPAPLVLPARAVAARLTERTTAGGAAPVAEREVPVDVVELREAGPGRVAGTIQPTDEASRFIAFDAPVAGG